MKIINTKTTNLINKDFEEISKVIINSIEPIISYSEEIKNDFIENAESEIIKERLKYRDLFLAKEDEKNVGIVGYKNNKIRNMFVHKDYQNKGIGSKLIQSILKKYKNKSIKVNILITATKFYEKNGFKLNRKIISVTDYSGLTYKGYEYIYTR